MTRRMFAVILLLSLFALTTSAQAPSTLTPDERTWALSYMKETSVKFMRSIEGLSEAQWKFKAAPERWSIAETAEHIAKSEEVLHSLVVDRILASPASAEKKAARKPDPKLVVTKITDRSAKFNAPEFIQPTGKWPAQADVMAAFEAARVKNMELLKASQADMHAHFFVHPVMGEIDAYEWLVLTAAHTARHTAQIEEVKTAEGYPKK